MCFDTAAKTWDDDPTKVERSEKLAEVLKVFLAGKQPERALEFGCGTGLLSFSLKNTFTSIDLADTSAGMIEVLQEKIGKAGLKHFKPILLTDAAPLKSNVYDIIYSLLTMHHITDLEPVFKNFSRILKVGGYLCIADLVKEDGDFHNSEERKNVHHGFDKNTLINQVAAHGFILADYRVFHAIEKITETGDKKMFPLFLLIVQKK